ncbi:transposable element Tc1 transposase [Trichonephila clavipes]|nr:transposable element Tc1 transposase [Trichonephila clavipes]
MPLCSIRAHYEQLSEFERGRIIGLKKSVFRDKFSFQLCPDKHRRRVWRRPVQRADPAITIAGHTSSQQGVIYLGLVFQQDNAKPHTTRIPMNCLTAYQTLPCPARLPDPSPIEHVWDMMRRRLHLPGNVDGLARQLEQIWQEIPQETIRVIYQSISCRVAACIQAKRGSIPY